MNKLLLDTHIFLWSILAPEKLNAPVVQALTDPVNEVWLSPVSVWEALLLAQKGRLALNGDPAAWLQNALDTLPLKEAPLNYAVALQSRTIQLPHQDPADRFIAATALVYGLTLVTSDRHLINAARSYAVLIN